MRDDPSLLSRRSVRDGSWPPVGRWLADEVAIDFPSMVPLVDRMRRALLGDDGSVPALSVDLQLTPAEAGFGRRVPLDLALRGVCRSCGGRGEVWAERCATCGGSGEAPARCLVHVYVPSGVRDGARLQFTVAAPHAAATVVRLNVRVG